LKGDPLPKIRPLSEDARPLFAGTPAALRSLMAERLGNAVVFCTHVGSSMKPSLCDRDLLEVVPPHKKPPRVGDVIVFHPPTGDRTIVHRVIGTLGDGMRTRGDNSPAVDPWLLRRRDVMGRVVARWRAQKRRKVAGGRIGWALCYLAHWYNALHRAVSVPLRPIYRFFARGGTLRHLLPRSLRPRAVAFRCDGQTHIRLLMGKRVVGWYDRRSRGWSFQRPYRLFVDERPLARRLPDRPRGDPPHSRTGQCETREGHPSRGTAHLP
jgi:hypothetical protein